MPNTDGTLTKLTDAIRAAGGPSYQWRQINPVNDQEGGEPGGNIRVAFLFKPGASLSFVDRGTPSSTEGTDVVAGKNGAQLTRSPGRIDPGSAAWADSRVPLVGEFSWRGKPLFVIGNHFASKGGDQPPGRPARRLTGESLPRAARFGWDPSRQVTGIPPNRQFSSSLGRLSTVEAWDTPWTRRTRSGGSS